MARVAQGGTEAEGMLRMVLSGVRSELADSRAEAGALKALLDSNGIETSEARKELAVARERVFEAESDKRGRAKRVMNR